MIETTVMSNRLVLVQSTEFVALMRGLKKQILLYPAAAWKVGDVMRVMLDIAEPEVYIYCRVTHLQKIIVVESDGEILVNVDRLIASISQGLKLQ